MAEAFENGLQVYGEILGSDRCDYEDAIFKGPALFLKNKDGKPTVFKRFANFKGATFQGEVDFSNAIFEDGASFVGAKFFTNGKNVKFDDAWFRPSKNNVSFDNAQFGKKYQNSYGEWKIRFTRRQYEGRRDQYGITGWKPKSGKEKAYPKGISGKDDIPGILIKWGVAGEFHLDIQEAFTTFLLNPTDVSFINCLFGELDLENKNILPDSRMKEIAEKEKKRMEEQYLPRDEKEKMQEGLELFTNHYGTAAEKRGEATDDTKKAVTNILSRCLERGELETLRKGPKMLVSFDSAAFSNGRHVFFSNVAFSNGGYVWFISTAFSNGGGVNFASAAFSNSAEVLFYNTAFSNGRSVNFDSVSFSNHGKVFFESATFSNGGDVDFNSAAFSNGEYVSFRDSAFSNGGSVNFASAAFSNGGDVSFNKAVFKNKGEVVFAGSLWVNDGGFSFTGTRFDDEINARFDQCIFLCEGKIDFANSRLPREGSFRFMNCHVADIKRPDGYAEVKVDFNNVYFRHAVFEGGEIKWISELKEKNNLKKVTINDILEDREIKPPEKTKEWINELKEKGKDRIPETTGVFDDDVVVSWKGITSESAKNITFRLVNLSRSLFDGMTLSHVELNAPRWRKKWLRSILYEEEVIRKKFKDEDLLVNDDYRRQIEGLENQYTQLKTNLESQGNYRDAGEAHYGEKEMRRMQFSWISQYLSLTFLYRFFAGYGERPLRSFVWLLVFLIAVPNILWGISWYMYECGKTLSTPKDFLPNFVQLITPFSWKNDGAELINANRVYYSVLIFTQILFYIQLPLFIMAVRRRFKR